MEPIVSSISQEEDTLRFTISNINVSLANAIRRTILSDIPTVVFRTFPHEENRADIQINTTRMNNEIIKQRLSCIPIHITDTNFPLEDFVVEVHKKNNSDTIDFVTTEDFKVKDVKSEQYLSDADNRKIFPPSPLTGDYIDVVRLRPKISDEIHGEEFKMTARFDIGTSGQDGAFNVVSTCAYGATQDPTKINEIWSKKIAVLKSEGMSPKDIEEEKQNWLLLDAKRITKPDSFDYTIETVGVFSNMDLVFKACHIIMDKIQLYENMIQTDESLINPSENTIVNCFDITIKGEDYTIGKILEYLLFTKYYNKTLTFCGFSKPHPHNSDSIIRLAFKNPTEVSEIVSYIVGVSRTAIKIFEKLASDFEQ